MGRGSSKVNFVTAINNARKIDDTGYDTAVTGRNREIVEAFEREHINDTVESSLYLDENGNVLGHNTDRTGNSVGNVFDSREQEAEVVIMTHNHPTAEGRDLSGTFYEGDMMIFTNEINLPNLRTIRAAGREGTYSMTRQANFRGEDFLKAYASWSGSKERALDRVINTANSLLKSGSITDNQFTTMVGEAYDAYHTNMHNWFTNNQTRYGYTYTLERR